MVNTNQTVTSPDALERSESTETRDQLIRARAFELYEERGREEGHAEEDWAQAELEILSRQSGKKID